MYSDYKILFNINERLLEEQVNSFLKLGYIPLGGLSVNDDVYFQTVAKFIYSPYVYGGFITSPLTIPSDVTGAK